MKLSSQKDIIVFKYHIILKHLLYKICKRNLIQNIILFSLFIAAYLYQLDNHCRYKAQSDNLCNRRADCNSNMICCHCYNSNQCALRYHSHYKISGHYSSLRVTRFFIQKSFICRLHTNRERWQRICQQINE